MLFSRFGCFIQQILSLFGVIVALGAVVADTPSSSGPFTPPSSTELDPQVEARVGALLGRLTTNEKIDLVSGIGYMNTQAIPRLGIPSLKFSDGPVGVRCWGRSTAYPADVLLAATWDAPAAREMGESIGRDARARGVHVVLGPGTNIYREAQNGRNFEYMGEDPVLASAMVVNYIQGLQSQGVAACIKHFVANEQETRRFTVNMIVGRRALEEIYLPPFKAAVQEGNVWTAMAAYNEVNGEFSTASKFLLTDILRDQWHFQGVLMSDWGAAHATLKDLNAGMDLEMDMTARKFYNRSTISPLLESGRLDPATLDEHVRRILRLIVSLGFMDRDQTDASISRDDPRNADVALKVASEGIVLLRNKDNILPLDRRKIHRLVVVGPNATPAVIAGGGSSGVTPFSAISVLDALKTVAGDGVQIDYIPDASDFASSLSPFTPEDPADGEEGMSADYFDNPDLQGKPVAHRVDHDIQFSWELNAPLPGIPGGSGFSVRWRGVIQPPQSGDYVLASASDDGSRVFLDGRKVVDNWGAHPLQTRQAVVHLDKDRSCHVVVEYFNEAGLAEMHFGWALQEMSDAQKADLSAADAVIFAGGLNPGLEHEGADRTWKLPAPQERELGDVVALNPHIIAAINAGGNLGLGDALDRISALLWAWYPGQNGNLALAKIIFGDTDPSGHLPDSFEKRFEDGPAYGNFPGDAANGGAVHLDEGIYVGYRWFDKKGIAPAFPFGFGLSYTTFDLGHIQVATDGQGDNRRFTVSVPVTNTGSRDGADVVQLYVQPVSSSIDRPVQELKGFARVMLRAGETQTITLPLARKDFATYDEASSSWIAPPGAYRLTVGSSSRDDAQSAQINW